MQSFLLISSYLSETALEATHSCSYKPVALEEMPLGFLPSQLVSFDQKLSNGSVLAENTLLEHFIAA